MMHLEKFFTMSSTLTLAGWLFADLLLGLSMLFLVSGSRGHLPTATPTLTPAASRTPALAQRVDVTPTLTLTASPTVTWTPTLPPKPSVTPSATPAAAIQPGLDAPQCYNLELFSADTVSQTASITRVFQAQLPNELLNRAGLVMIWVHGSDMQEGVRVAREVGRQLQAVLPQSFGNAQIKSLYFDTGNLYHVQLEVYFYTPAQWRSGSEAPCEYLQ